MSVVTADTGEKRMSRSGGVRQDGNRWYSRTWIVVTDNLQDGPKTVIAAPGMPKKWDGYSAGTETDTAAKLITVDPDQIADKVWEVQLKYDTDYQDKDKDDPDEDPTNPETWVWHWSMDFMEREKAAQYEVDEGYDEGRGKGIVNSAGEPFDPTIMIPEFLPVFTFTRKMLEADAVAYTKQFAVGYTGVMNNNIFWGRAAKDARIIGASVSPPETFQSGGIDLRNRTFTWQIGFNWDSWDVSVIDQGSYYIAAGKRVSFISPEGQPYVGLLDGNGGAVAIGGDPVLRTFTVFEEKDYGRLGIPNL